MAQLKLMKKEWFNWFDKTFLDNITAWTEYYYINPDSQHWISNNLLNYENSSGSSYGVTYSTTDGIIRMKGTWIGGAGGYSQATMIRIFLDAGTYTLSAFNPSGLDSSQDVRLRVTDIAFDVIQEVVLDGVNKKLSFTLSEPKEVRIFVRMGSFSSENDFILKPVLTKGASYPEAFNPHLIKIEDILEVVDLGSLNYEKSQSGLFLTRGLMDKIKLPPSSDVVLKTIYSPIYNVIKSADITGPLGPNPSPDMVMAVNFEGVIYLNNLSYTDVNEFKQAMTGVYVIFVKKDSPLG